MEIINSDFFAPASANILDSLVAEYRSKRNLIETFHADYESGNIREALHYFCQRSADRYPDFELQNAICALNSEFWRRALELTDVEQYMPQARRSAWHEQLTAWRSDRYKYGENPEVDLPDFTSENAKAALMQWLNDRPKYLAEKVDGVFRTLSKEHVTNCPQGFGKRMILPRVVDDGGTIHWEAAGYIDDLRAVISKFMGRGEYPQCASREDLMAVQRHNGQWFSMDGGALRIRIYNGVGTAHIEVHPDIAWRLNEILAYLYPTAIPESFRRKPVKAKKIKDFELFDDVLPFAVCRALSGCEQARRLNPNRGYRENRLLPIRCGATLPKTDDKAVRKAAEAILVSLGGVKTMSDNSSYYQFDYDPLPVIAAVAASGRVPNQQSHQFYPTPDEVADLVMDYAEAGDCYSGHWLEPSAGIGGLAMRMPHELTTCVEISPLHCRILESQAGYAEVINTDFMTWQGEQRFCRIVMNPPYSDGRWRAHTERAASMLDVGGRLVAVLPASAKDKFAIAGLECNYSKVLKNKFAGTGIDVVILVADKL